MDYKSLPPNLDYERYSYIVLMTGRIDPDSLIRDICDKVKPLVVRYVCLVGELKDEHLIEVSIPPHEFFNDPRRMVRLKVDLLNIASIVEVEMVDPPTQRFKRAYVAGPPTFRSD